MLWLSTRKGLFRLDPVTGKTKHFYHDPGDPSSLGDNDIKSTNPPVRTEQVGFGSAPARRSTNLIGTLEE
jgi:hypothetical protein